MIVRDCRSQDSAEVRELLEAVFPTPAEADLVEHLRVDGDAALELIAEGNGETIGHVLFSRLDAPFSALALAPVAVLPAHQRRGIGSALIEAGHERARAAGYDAIFVLGEPEYYRRFGYDAALAAGFSSPYSGAYYMALPLHGALPASNGDIRHAPAFSALG